MQEIIVQQRVNDGFPWKVVLFQDVNMNGLLCVLVPSVRTVLLLLLLRQVKKYFELEPLARGKRWILEGSSTDHMEAVKEVFGHFIGLLEDKDTEPAGRI